MDIRPRLASSPQEAVPSGRLALQELSRRLRTGEPLALVTVQHPAVLQQLRSTGVARNARTLSDEHLLLKYEWIVDRMRTRLGHGPVDGHGPIWAWARITRRHLLQHVVRGELLMTLRVPQDRVLLVSAEDWVAVLNGSPLPAVDVPIDAYDDEFDRLWDEQGDGVWSAAAREPVNAPAEVQRQWDQIFDIGAYPRRHYVQACVAEIRAEDVVDVVEVALL